MSHPVSTVHFSHPKIGTLTIETGLDIANWGYNLNTAVFPTYGGEVVQILSVYIDDLKLSGSVATYSQCEAIYSYFASYFQIATQGRVAKPHPGQSSYNTDPVSFVYPEREWDFKIYPMSAPGFSYNWDAVTRQWQLVAHVIDASPDLDPIKDSIKNQVIQQQLDGFARINGEISPDSGNPETNPFQTYDQAAEVTTAAVKKNSDYYNSLIPAYAKGDFSALTGGLGATPSSILTGGTSSGTQTTVPSNG